MSGSLWYHGVQHFRLPCPLLSPGVCSISCPFSWWCHPTISSSGTPVSFCPQSFPASGSFPVSQFFASGGQSTGASASSSVLPMNLQSWFPLELTGLISWLQSMPVFRFLDGLAWCCLLFCHWWAEGVGKMTCTWIPRQDVGRYLSGINWLP